MKVGIIGLGRIAVEGFGIRGVETHMDGIRQIPDLELAATYDIAKPCTHAGVNEVAEACDIVAVCTPPETHREICETIANHHNVLAVICEKPMAPSVEDAEAIARALSDRILIVGHQRRYESSHQAIRDSVQAKRFGEPTAIRSWFSGDYLNNGTHAADLCRFLGDDLPWSIERRDSGFGVHVAFTYGSIERESYGALVGGYMRNMYQDAMNCIESGDTPQCSGDDGIEAVRHALLAKERDEYVERL